MKLAQMIREKGLFRNLTESKWPWSNEKYTDIFSGLTTNALDSLMLLRYGSRDVYSGVTSDIWDYITEFIGEMNLQKWNGLLDTYLLEYNPIENYSMTEKTTENGSYKKTGSGNSVDTETGSHNIVNGGSDTHSITGSITDTKNLSHGNTATVTTTLNKDGSVKVSGTEATTGTDNYAETEKYTNYKETTENQVSAFNSSAYQPESKTDFSKSGTIVHDKTRTADLTIGTDSTTTNSEQNKSTENTDATLTDSGTDTRSWSDYVETDSKNTTVSDTISNAVNSTSSNKEDGNDTRTVEHTRSGNIGVTTSQQMIEAQRALVREIVLNTIFDDYCNELLTKVWS